MDVAALRFGTTVDENLGRVDVSAWHPLFRDLDDATQRHLTYLALDNVLGEDGVERWCGAVKVSGTPPDDPGVDANGLRELIERLAASATRERYALAQDTTPDGAVRFAMWNRSLKQIDHLDKAFRLRLVVHLRTPSPNGMPTDDESRDLQSLEDSCIAALPDAVYAGRVTSKGKRTLNWYVADSTLARSSARELVSQGAWRVDVKVDPDPRWEGLSKGFRD
jgi:hypothetical protein